MCNNQPAESRHGTVIKKNRYQFAIANANANTYPSASGGQFVPFDYACSNFYSPSVQEQIAHG
jgi:hypothetical protein